MSRRLDLSRNQVLGAAAIIGVVVIWVIVVPFINGSVKGDNPFEVGLPYDFGDGSTVVPADGWSLDPGSSPGLFTVLTKGGAKLTLTGSVESSAAIEDALQTSIDGLGDDPSGTHWQVGDIEAFTTDAGASGGTVAGHSTRDVATTWIIDDGSHSLTALGTVSESNWQEIDPEMQEMIRSIVIDGPVDQDEEATP